MGLREYMRRSCRTHPSMARTPISRGQYNPCSPSGRQPQPSRNERYGGTLDDRGLKCFYIHPTGKGRVYSWALASISPGILAFHACFTYDYGISREDPEVDHDKPIPHTYGADSEEVNNYGISHEEVDRSLKSSQRWNQP
ncbi:hypothetical protein BDN72DRAFT_567717 [Pluteus cervinus]|uniref:Uncharacterized protein n=1 Tax=Pluteus cervinus TaxID=181527 RepID=A0ACD3A2P1_9AGAR|nr:hypothetical protein BDN72DRAFT_567717 [Pluteus cervinus]